MNVLAIDPGPTQSQFLLWSGKTVVEHAILPNTVMCAAIPTLLEGTKRACIEMVACYGMPVGKEVFDTCVWIGRFYGACESCFVQPVLVYRQAVKMHLCHSMRAKDSNIRQALIDRFGGKDAAIGKKASPGPLFGVKSHGWAALALAITFSETNTAA